MMMILPQLYISLTSRTYRPSLQTIN